VYSPEEKPNRQNLPFDVIEFECPSLTSTSVTK
jgi:hypothetical protein